MNNNIELNNNGLVVIHRTPKGIESFNKTAIKNNNDNPIGCKLRSKNCGWFKVLRKTNKKSNNNYLYEIEFIETGYKYDVKLGQIIKGNVKDLLSKSICGIACPGDEYKKFKKQYPKLHNTLRDRYGKMISRCYDPSDSSYYNYGALGCKVSEDWLNFSNYFQDILDIIYSMDNPEEVIECLISGKLFIDKDIKQRGIKEKVYSKDTISIVTRTENSQQENQDNREVSHFKYAYLKDEKPVWKSYNNISKFAREHNLGIGNIINCLNDERLQAYRYIFRKLTDEEYILLESLGFPDNYELSYVSEDILNKKYLDYISIFAYACLKDGNPVWKSYSNESKFAREHNLYQANIHACLINNRSHTGNYIFRKITNEEYQILERLGFPDNYELGYVNNEAG